MAALETRLQIDANDNTGSAFRAIEKRIAAIDASVGGWDRMAASIGKVASQMDRVASHLGSSQRVVGGIGGAAATVAGFDRSATSTAIRGQVELARAATATGEAVATSAETSATAEARLGEAAQAAAAAMRAQGSAGGALEGAPAQVQALAEAEAHLAVEAGKSGAALVAQGEAAQKSLTGLTGEADAVGGLGGELQRFVSNTQSAAESQAMLLSRLEETTAAMTLQGREAVTAARQIATSQRRQAQLPPMPIAPLGGRPRGGGEHGLEMGGGLLPMSGPVALEEAKKAAEAGATVQDRIAELMAAGAKPEQIDQARGDFREFSKTHAGILEADYLAGYKDARVIAPAESFEMAKHAAVYRSALRNSGLSTSEHDVGDALRVMDEIGLKTDSQRQDFINQILKTQQTFGDQVPVSTLLAAIRNAKSSVYRMSPDFINKYLPTLLQSSGQQGGTEAMTAYSNYVGQHMQHAEFVGLANAGFVNNRDLLYDKNGKVKGLRQGAKMFEEGLFGSNVAEWSWKFHDQFMKRKGATEEGFEKLVAGMPRGMGALVDFFVHNQGRVKRDIDTREGAIGDKAADNSAMAQNPGASLNALGAAITQFAASVTSPAMDAVGPSLTRAAQGIQSLAAATAEWAKDHPDAAKAMGGGGLTALSLFGAWQTGNLLSGLGKMVGIGEEGGIVSGLTGLIGRLGVLGAVVAATETFDPKGNFGGLTSGLDAWIKSKFGFDPSNIPLPDLSPPKTAYIRGTADLQDELDARKANYRAGYSDLGLASEEKREHSRARALSGLGEGHEPMPVRVQVSGSADSTVTVHVEASSSLLQIVERMQRLMMEIPLHDGGGSSGRMDGDAAPKWAHSMFGRR